MKLRSTLLLLLSFGVLAYVIYYTISSPYKVSSEDAKKLLRNQKIDTVLDVRTNTEYTLGHYPNSLNIPTATLKDQVETMIPDKDTRILIY
jgi:rhodanese-related sulfurtransferase